MVKKPLSDKQKTFCKHYIKDLNGTQAALRAGYSEKTAGQIANNILKEPHIREYINKLLAKKSKRAGIDADYVLNGIKEATEKALKENKLTQALKGYELLGKHLKLFTDVQETKHTFTQMGRVVMNKGGEQKALSFNVGSDPNVIENPPQPEQTPVIDADIIEE